VFAYAIEAEFKDVKFNPARDVPYFTGDGEGHHTWELEEVQRYEERHPVGTMAHLALALLLYLGQRRSDVVEFGPGMVKDGWLHFTQVKNRKRKPVKMALPVIPELQRIIDATPGTGSTYMVNGLGGPFTANGFGNWFADRCVEAGVPGRAHGLRKAASARLAELGCSEREIMAITGHKTSKEVDRYTKAARQKVLAKSAMEKLTASMGG
jgi:integrase